MERINQLFNQHFPYLLSMGFMIIILSGCGQDNREQDTAEDTQQETVQEERMQPEATQEDQQEVATQEAQEEVASQETQENERQVAEARQPAQRQPTSDVSPTPKNNPILESVSVKYKEWDADGNNVVDPKEFYEGFYKVWDENEDNAIDQDEFDRATNNFFASYNFKEYGEFTDWDQNDDNQIKDQEFRENMNSIVEASENGQVAQRLFVIWDQDNDDKIEKIELENITVMLDNDDN